MARVAPRGTWQRRLSDAVQGVVGQWNAGEKDAYASGRRPLSELCLPDFLVIGAQKAGTSWLHRNLRRHPELYLPVRKELHYFDREFHRSLRYYSAYFRPGRNRVRGEVTPAYSILPQERIQFIHTLMPQARLILILRHPVDRAWSHAVMGLARKRGRPVEAVTEAEWLAHFQLPRSRDRSDYPGILARWEGVYHPDQLWVGFFDDLVQQPEAFLRSVFRHLGVNPDVDLTGWPLREATNSNPRTQMPPACRAALEALYADEIEQLHARFGEKVAHWRIPR